jgi:hypothetical protein
MHGVTDRDHKRKDSVFLEWMAMDKKSIVSDHIYGGKTTIKA